MQFKMKNKLIILIGFLLMLSVLFVEALTLECDPPCGADEKCEQGTCVIAQGSCLNTGEKCAINAGCCSEVCCGGTCCTQGSSCVNNVCGGVVPGSEEVWDEGITVPIKETDKNKIADISASDGKCEFAIYPYKTGGSVLGKYSSVNFGGAIFGYAQTPLLICNKFEKEVTISDVISFSENLDSCKTSKNKCIKANDGTDCESQYESCVKIQEELFTLFKSLSKRIDISKDDQGKLGKIKAPVLFNYFYEDSSGLDLLKAVISLDSPGVDGKVLFRDTGGYYLEVNANNGGYDKARFRYGCQDIKLYTKKITADKSGKEWIPTALRQLNDQTCADKPLNFKFILQGNDYVAGVLSGKCLYAVQYVPDTGYQSLCFDDKNAGTPLKQPSDCSCYKDFTNGENIVGTGACDDGIDNDGDGFCDLGGCSGDLAGKEDAACKCAYAKWKQSKSTKTWEEWFKENGISEFKKPQCSDGIDNDNNGKMDKEDESCFALKEDANLGCAGKSIITEFPISIEGIYDLNNYEPCKESEAAYSSWVLIPGRCAMAGKGADEDGDGVCSSEDCNDKNALVKKGAKDVCGDGLDQDCDGKDCVAECKWDEYKKCSTICTDCQGVWTRLPDSMFPHVEGGAAINDGNLYAIAGRTNLGNRLWGIDKYCWLVAWNANPKPKSMFNLIGVMEKYNFTTGLWETHNEPEKRWIAPNPDYTNWLYLQYDPALVGGGANAEENKPLVGNSFESVGDWIYLIAGYGLPAVNAHALSVIYSFNPETDWWGRVATIGVDCRTETCGRGASYGQQNTMYHGSTVIGNKIYIFGGISNAAYGSNELDFTTYDELKTSGAMGNSVKWNSDLFVIDTSKIEYFSNKPYTPKLQTLSSNGGRAKLKSASNPRKSPGVFSYDGNVYVIGGRVFNADGRSYASNQKMFQMYDPETNSWTQLSNSIYEHGLNPGVVVKDNKVYVVGGSTIPKPAGTTNVEYYVLNESRWVDVKKTINQPDFPIGNGIGIEYEGKLYYISTVGGGTSKESNDGKSSVLMFDPEAKAEDSTKLYQACSMFNTFKDSPCYENVPLKTTAATCTSGETKECNSGYGVCEELEQECDGGNWESCDYSDVDDYESTETSCDELDNDCDGTIDEGCECEEDDEQDCELQDGVCEDSVQECGDDLVWEECDYGDDYEEDEDSCSDELDNDCDGDVDKQDDDCDTTSSSSSSSNNCRDGTKNGECSSTKPMRCVNSFLTFDCNDCGCSGGKTCKEDNTCGKEISESQAYKEDEDEEEVSQEFTQEPIVEDEGGGIGWLIFILIVLLLGGIGTYLYFTKFKKIKKPMEKKNMTKKQEPVKSKRDLSKLVDYIKNARGKGMQDSHINTNLRMAGWAKEDVEEAFSSLKEKKRIFNFIKFKGNKKEQAR
ncbi:MAG: MopE-related protein [Candidatus Nanoarchaeia archaeon]|nr:MopE-related protein [Candidatus Nanoarchaeia archaeon]